MRLKYLLTLHASRTDWAEDDDDEPQVLPPPEVVKNANGTETHITYRIREDGKKVKTIRIIRRSVNKTKVNPRVAERRQWAKFGASAKDAPGPQSDTTSVGENIELYPRIGYRAQEKDEAQSGMAELEAKKAALKTATVKCRICNGEHFTARCPFKGTMAPEGEPGVGPPADDPMAESAGGAAAGVKGSYVPPALRKGASSAAGEKMGGKYERDDLATLRVTNVRTVYLHVICPNANPSQVSEYAEEAEIRDMFERWGRVTRVFLAKDRDTGRAKGFAFVSFADRDDAAKACAKMDGYGYNNLILRVEFAKKTT